MQRELEVLKQERAFIMERDNAKYQTEMRAKAEDEELKLKRQKQLAEFFEGKYQES